MANTRINNRDIKKPLTEEDITLSSGVDILATVSGGNDIGTLAKPFNNIYTNNLIFATGSASASQFVNVTGDQMTGDLTMGSASNLLAGASGIGNFGSPSIPFNSFFGRALSVENGITLAGATADILTTSSGTNDIGSMSNPFDVIYAKAFVGGSGIVGNITLVSGTDIIPNESGTSDLGTSSLPFGEAFIMQAHIANLTGLSPINVESDLVLTSGQKVKADTLNNSTAGIDLTVYANSGIQPNLNLFADGIVRIGGNITTEIDASNTFRPAASGSQSLGENVRPWGTLYVNNIGTTLTPSASGSHDLGSVAKPFNTVYALNIVSSGDEAQFVAKAGDTMTGDLVMDGAGIVTNSYISGNGGSLDIMDSTEIFMHSANNSSFLFLDSGGVIQLDAESDMQIFISGNTMISINATTTEISNNLLPNTSGTRNIGSVANPFNTIYALNIVSSGDEAQFVQKTGDTMTGDLHMDTASITSDSSTVQTGKNSIAYGTLNFVSGLNSIVIGDQNTLASDGDFTIIVGAENTVADFSNAVFGFGHGVNGQINIVAGNGHIVGGDLHIVAGDVHVVSGTANAVFGIGNETFGGNSLAIGSDNTALSNSMNAFVGGNFSKVRKANDFAFGKKMETSGTTGGSFALGDNQNVVTVNATNNSMLLRFQSGVTITSDTDIFTQGSGTSDIGSVANPFNTIYALNIVSSGDEAQFVQKAGDTMTGGLTLSSAAIAVAAGADLMISGSNGDFIRSENGTGEFNINSAAAALNLTSAANINIDFNGTMQITGNGSLNIIHAGNFTLKSYAGGFIELANSGTAVVRIAGSTDEMTLSAVDGITASGTVSVSSNIIPETSGTQNIGSVAVPFGNVYSTGINGETVVKWTLNEVPTPIADSAEKFFTLANSPFATDSVMLNVSGVYMVPSGIGAPSFDYEVVSGNMIEFVTAPITGSTIIANYTHL